MTYAELEQMSDDERANYFRSLPLATLLRLAGDAADPLLEQISEIPHLNLEGVERLDAHKAAKAETASLMSRLTGQG